MPAMTIEDIAAELKDMLEATLRNPTVIQRILRQRLTVLYEFLPPDAAETDSEPPIVPYLLVISPERSGVTAASAPYQDVDVVVRTTPDTLHRVTNGELGGREAVVSGQLDIRKVPSMPKLLLLRALFNVHKKSRLRKAATPAASDTHTAAEIATDESAR